jgi:hypothetical protein
LSSEISILAVLAERRAQQAGQIAHQRSYRKLNFWQAQKSINLSRSGLLTV